MWLFSFVMYLRTTTFETDVYLLGACNLEPLTRLKLSLLSSKPVNWFEISNQFRKHITGYWIFVTDFRRPTMQWWTWDTEPSHRHAAAIYRCDGRRLMDLFLPVRRCFSVWWAIAQFRVLRAGVPDFMWAKLPKNPYMVIVRSNTQLWPSIDCLWAMTSPAVA